MTPVSLLAFMSFGFTEILVIGVVALLVFGGQLPDVMRNVGRAYAKFRQGLHEISKPVRQELRDLTDTRVTPTPRATTPAPDPEPEEEPTSADPQGGDVEPEYEVGEPPRASIQKASPDPWLDDEPPPV